MATLNDLAFEIEGLDLGTRKIAVGFSTIGAYQVTAERQLDLTVVIPGQLREIIQVPLRYCVIEGSQQAEGRKPGETVDGKRLLVGTATKRPTKSGCLRRASCSGMRSLLKGFRSWPTRNRTRPSRRSWRSHS